MTVVLAAQHLCPPGPPRPGWVAVTDGSIVEVGRDTPPPAGAVDLGDVVLAPGYVDLQVNGVGSCDFASAERDEWQKAAEALRSHGVTAYCPTLVSAPTETYPGALDRAARARDAASAASLPAVLGVHLEGPFLGGAPGAHPTRLLRPMDVPWLDALLDAHPGLVRIVTLAPEADPGFAGIRHLAAAGVLVALGHSRATYDEARAATDAGARAVTHVFNGMGPLHHRDPGLVGAALDDERLTPTLIADLVHVHPALVRIVMARRSTVAVVSDVVALHGDVRSVDGAARLRDGTLAGATSMLDRAVANLVSVGVPVERAIASATAVPADLVGATDRGRIAPGASADLVALDADTLAPRRIWLAGIEVAGEV